MVQAFNESTAEQRPLAGGKGGTLGRLYQAGYPVPDGFVILPAAFEGDTLKLEAWQQVQAQLDHMRQVENGMAAFAVRFSALSEDSAFASFAGEFETVLDVHSDAMVRAAIVTDVGAPLSHAAIIARELGIPAVVGCGDATMRLMTGDRMGVDGGQGIVEILDAQ
jgi:phosphoenolpyruvate synthase/pyruvate phosphate dikinase